VRISPFLSLRIRLRHRTFGEPVAESQDLVVKVVFQLVSVEPFLPDVDFWVLQQCGPIRSESVGDLGAVDSRK